MKVSYLVTGCLALLAALIGYAMVESQARGDGSALNVIWGRMNGWGFAAGCLCSLVPSLAMLVRAFVPEGHFLKAKPENYYTYATLASSTLACVAVSWLTPPIKDETTTAYYAKVRPFGLWKDAAAKARQAGLAMATVISVPQIILNVALGLVTSNSLYMAPVYFLGHWNLEGTACSGIFAACCVVLYFT